MGRRFPTPSSSRGSNATREGLIRPSALHAVVRRGLAAVILAGLLAGCVPPPVLEPPLEMTEGARVGDDGAVEASVATRGATVLVCASAETAGAPLAWVSHDAGASFEEVALPDEPATRRTRSCDAAIADSGAWVLVAATPLGEVVLVSEDNGRAWRAQTLPAPAAPGRPSLAVHGRTVYLLDSYLDVLQGPVVALARSDDLGASWGARVPIPAPDASRAQRVVGDVAVAPDGAVLVPLRAGDALMLAVSRDRGANWTTSPARDAPGFGAPQVAASQNGTLWLASIAGAPGDAAVELASSNDTGASWSAPARLAVGEPAGVVALAAGADVVDVAWVEATPAALVPRLARLHVDEARVENATLAPGGPGEDVARVGIAFVEGRVLVAWALGDGVWLAREAPARGSAPRPRRGLCGPQTPALRARCGAR